MIVRVARALVEGWFRRGAVPVGTGRIAAVLDAPDLGGGVEVGDG